MDLTNAVFCFVGAFMGFLYVSFSWRGKSSVGTHFQDDPRVRGLVWGISGVLMILIADWDKFLRIGPAEPSQVTRAMMLGYYVFGFIAASFASLIALSIRVAIDAASTERKFPDLFHNSGISPFVQFILYGYQDYQERVMKAIESMREDELSRTDIATRSELLQRLEQSEDDARELRSAIQRRKQTAIQLSEIIRSDMALHRACLAGKIERLKAAEGMLRSTIGATAYFSGVNPNLINANYMTVESRAHLTESDIDAAKFAYGDKSRYRQYLSLRQYFRKGTPTIRLPLEPLDDHRWQDRTLPGAPEAFLKREPVLCLSRAPKFGREVPLDVQKEQIAYLSTQPFDAILAFPLTPELAATRDASPIGVLNIDIRLNGHLKADQIDLEELEALLAPCTAMLAEVVSMEFVR